MFFKVLNFGDIILLNSLIADRKLQNNKLLALEDTYIPKISVIFINTDAYANADILYVCFSDAAYYIRSCVKSELTSEVYLIYLNENHLLHNFFNNQNTVMTNSL
jgi:hypothetical protein